MREAVRTPARRCTAWVVSGRDRRMEQHRGAMLEAPGISRSRSRAPASSPSSAATRFDLDGCDAPGPRAEGSCIGSSPACTRTSFTSSQARPRASRSPTTCGVYPAATESVTQVVHPGDVPDQLVAGRCRPRSESLKTSASSRRARPGNCACLRTARSRGSGGAARPAVVRDRDGRLMKVAVRLPQSA
jgi:hypothetical protein